MNNLKNLLASFTLLLLLATVNTNAAPVDLETAKNVAKNFLATSNAELELIPVEVANTKLETQLQASTNIPFYIFNVENNGGWIIVAADDAVTPILAFSFEGKWDANNVPPAAAFMLEGYAMNIDSIAKIEGKQANELWNELLIPQKQKNEDRFQASVGPLLTTKWGQWHPFNYFTYCEPDGTSVAGCSWIAKAQIMNYHKWPIFGKSEDCERTVEMLLCKGFDTTGFDCDNILIDWDNMVDTVCELASNNLPNNSINDEQRNAVAMLIRLIPSGAYLYGYDRTTELLIRDSFTVFAWDAILINELENNRPIYYSGLPTATDYMGHAWVVDGYKKENNKIYYHMNYGWGGLTDGFYILGQNPDFPARHSARISYKPLKEFSTVVTSELDDGGDGTLRNIVENAPPGSRITFAPNVKTITLTRQNRNISDYSITLDKDITIDGGNDTSNKVTIKTAYASGHIFRTRAGGDEPIINLYNLILRDASNAAIWHRSGLLKAINCSFVNNGGGVTGCSFIAINCSFVNNNRKAGGSAVNVSSGNFIAINCSFINNSTEGDGGAIYSADNFNTATVINSSFINNTAQGKGGAIANNSNTYLYHCTFDNNESGGVGGAVFNNSGLYSYNSIFTANKEAGIITSAGQISGNMLGGNNLIDNGSTITRATVFGTNELTNGFIKPLQFAKSATALTLANIAETPENLTRNEVIGYLTADQVAYLRPTSGNVTFGAAEATQTTKTNSMIVTAGLFGTILPPSEYFQIPSGATRTITALPDRFYQFKNWTSNGNVISTSNPLNVTITQDTTLTANFELIQNELTVSTAEGGNVSGGGIFDVRTRQTVSAVADDFYYFKHWEDKNGKIISRKPTYSFAFMRDTVLFAVFGEEDFISLELFSEPANSGTATQTGIGKYDTNASVTITATAFDCYTFINWTDSGGKIISEENPLEIIVISDTTLTANFGIIQYEIILDATEGGSVIGAGSFDCGSTQTITAIENEYFEFLHWTSNDTVISEENPFTFLLTQDTLIVANFIEDTTSISQTIKSGLVNIIPNPTKDNFEISFEVIKSGNIAISLLDLSGGKVFEIYNDFTVAGTFSKTVKTNNLARGIYYLKIEIDKNNSKIERIVFE